MKRVSFFAIIVFALAFAGAAQADIPSPKFEVKPVGNSVCPVSDNPVGGSPDKPHFYSDFKGYRIGFMCPVCKGKFDKADDAEKKDILNKALKSVGKPPLK